MKASIAYSNGIWSKSIQVEQSSDENVDDFLKKVGDVIGFLENGNGKVIDCG